MVQLFSLVCSSLLVLRITRADSCQDAPEPVIFEQKGPIADSQDLNSTFFIGTPAEPTELKPLYTFLPDAALMHTDGGNSGARDDPGPLGINPNISTEANSVNLMVWGPDGGLTCGYANVSDDGSFRLGLVALDPDTFQILASWYPPDNETLVITYMELIKETNDLIISTGEGHIYVVHRDSCNGKPYFALTRSIALAGELQPDQQMLNSMQDTAGNIWFTTGGVPSGGDDLPTSVTYGFVTPDGKVVKKVLDDEYVENGIAVSGMNVYMVTSPRTHATPLTGFMYSMRADGCEAITVNWRVPYPGDTSPDTGDAPRGSGSSPSLVTDKYVGITDRSTSQIHLYVYHQEDQGSAEKQLVCRVPIFEPGKGDNDNALLSHFDGKANGFIVQNDFGNPPLYGGESSDINGPWNDMSKMAGGITRVDVNDDGNCTIQWDRQDLKIKGVSILSTKVGLLYSYIQDDERAAKGEYVWYVAAIDWNTGETVYKVRTGTGGSFNDNYLQGSVGPDGTFYQTVVGGIVGVRDGQQVAY